MGIVSADQKRYKYVNDKWQVMGNADPGPFRNISLHPDSPSVGKTWSKGNVSFEKIKLTNNKEAHKCVSTGFFFFFFFFFLYQGKKF